MKVNFKNIFNNLQNENYCIIKLPFDFPNYTEGSDLDIFCYDIISVSNIIISQIHELVDHSCTIDVTEKEDKMYIDILDKGVIYLRFDLYSKLPSYKNILIKDSLFSSVIENSNLVDFGDIKIKIPNHIDEAILRYIEFHEWFASRPDKLKHIEYIERLVDNDSLTFENFYRKLHYYIELPRKLEKRKVSKYKSVRYVSYLLGKFRTLITMINENGIAGTSRYAINKYFRNKE